MRGSRVAHRLVQLFILREIADAAAAAHVVEGAAPFVRLADRVDRRLHALPHHFLHLAEAEGLREGGEALEEIGEGCAFFSGGLMGLMGRMGPYASAAAPAAYLVTAKSGSNTTAPIFRASS